MIRRKSKLTYPVAGDPPDLPGAAGELATASNMVARCERLIIDLRDEMSRRDEETRSLFYDLLSEIAALGSGGPEAAAYAGVIRRVREAVRNSVPRDCVVAVISKGDNALLDLYGRRVKHFPQDEAGGYAGHYPATSAAAIAHLEDLRVRGTQYLVIPSPAAWWLTDYPVFGQHLDRNYRLIHQADDGCRIYSLHEPGPWVELAQWIAAFKVRSHRFPAILDWQSGASLEKVFVECVVFSPPEPAREELPYVEKSIDVVAVCGGDRARLHEARRVATEVILVVTASDNALAGPTITMEISGQRDKRISGRARGGSQKNVNS